MFLVFVLYFVFTPTYEGAQPKHVAHTNHIFRSINDSVNKSGMAFYKGDGSPGAALATGISGAFNQMGKSIQTNIYIPEPKDWF